MKRVHIDKLLREGIEAAKRGHLHKAQELLMAVIEECEENEAAWLWLSSVVSSNEDRRVCLNNVLVINPDNQAAKRGLKRLNETNGELNNSSSVQSIRKEYKAISPAAALLYPDRQVNDWRWQNTIELETVEGLSFGSHSNFDDVWERENDICAYCASDLGYDEKRCPRCGKKLFSATYRYQRPSSDLTIYWVLLLGIAQISLLLVMLNLIVRQSLMASIWHGIVFIVFVVLVIGLYLRRFWAYVTSLVFLFFSVIMLSFNIILRPSLMDVVDEASKNGFFRSLPENSYLYLLGPLEELIVPLQLLAVVLAFFYGIFRIGPDFEKVKIRLVAQLDKGLNDASQFYATGQDYARIGMWATAVLHYQRAVALDPIRIHYQRSLAIAYAQIGFYRRSLDMLESASRIVRNRDVRLELERLKTDIQLKLAENLATEN